MRRIKPLLWLLALVCLPAAGQAVRYESNAYTINSSAPQPGGLYPVLSYPGATVAVCSAPANAVPCTNYATTYTSASGATACTAPTQLTADNSTTCTGTADAEGGWGVWIASGTYQYTVVTSYGAFGPYDFSVGGSGGGSGSYPSLPGIANCTGTPCVAWAPSYNTSTNPLPLNYITPSTTNGQILSTQSGVPTWIPPGGSSSPGGSVAYVEITAPGSYASCPTTVTFVGGGTPSVPAVAGVFCSNEGGIPVPSAIILSDAGYGYSSTPTVTISGGTGSGATAVAEMGSFVIALNTPAVPGTGPDPSLENGILTIPYYPNVIYTINGNSGAFIFNGAGVTCITTICTFTGGSSFITSLTTTGTSGPSTVSSGVLNIPQYAGGGSMTWPSLPGITTCTGTPCTAWGTSYGTSGTGTTVALTASPTFTGTPAAPTPATSDNSTTIANTAYTRAYIASLAYVTGSGTSGHCVQWGASNTLGDAGAACGSGGGGITALTGDVTASGSGSVAATLATVNSNVGTFGDATHTVTVTENAKGLATAISSNAIPTAATGTNGLASPDNSTIKAASGVLTTQNTTVDGVTCTPGSSCVLPVVSAQFVPVAQCNSAVAFATGATVYDNNAPPAGCYNTAASAAAYLSFALSPSANQYAQGVLVYPAYWTHTDAVLTFSTDTATSGTVTFTIQTACVESGGTAGAEGWSTGVAVATTVPGTVGKYTVSGNFASVGAPSLGGCPSSPTSPGQLAYRIFLSANSASGGNADLEGITFSTSRSQ